MNIKDIMSKDIKIAEPGAHLNEIAQMMQEHGCGCIIIAKDDRLVGVITDRDIVIRCVSKSHNPNKIKAEEIMSPKILYCRDTDEITDTALNMTRNLVRRLPVLDENKRLVGIVSLCDLAANSDDYSICGKALGHICAVLDHKQTENKESRHA
jgi:CBS domain-containing protein